MVVKGALAKTMRKTSYHAGIAPLLQLIR